MMRPYLSLLPALLIPLLLAAPAAHAEPSVLCQQIRDLDAVSGHYVQRVLDRANDGIAYARSAPAAEDFGRVLPHWARQVGASWARLLTSEVPITLEQQELPRITACLHFDVLLLECKMDEVRSELQAELSRGSVLGIMRLQSLLNFLNERVRHLRRGALDPLFADPDWDKRYDFDSPDSINDEEPEDDMLCPYDADYAPPFLSGFGCDIETMEPRASYPPVQAELDALRIISRQVEQARASGATLLEIQQTIDELFGNPSTTPPPPAEREHLNAFGCGWDAGYCTEDESIRCRSDGECGGDGACRVPERACANNRALRCANDTHCGGAGPCVDLEEDDTLPAARALRGPFSFRKDEIAILSDFLGARAVQEVSRSFRDDLKTPNEFGSDEQEQRDNREFSQRDPLSRWFRTDNRLTFQVWSRIQARNEALIFPEAVDAQLEIAEALKSLRTAVGRLSALASSREGVRAFVGRFAYFINRTCIYRPCNLMLERVIRIVTADECFPYTNGAYLEDTADNPRSRKCEEAAGIDG